MSKIIKNSRIVSNPRIIETINLPPLGLNNDNFIPVNETKNAEKSEVELLRNESEKIIKETENMVIELLQKAREEARLIIAEAQEEADVIRSKVYEEAQEIRKQAEKEGYEEGLNKAEEEMQKARAEAELKCQEIIEEARRIKLEIMHSVEDDMVRLAVAIAKKIIVAELKTNRESILEVIREAISFLDQPENITLRVNPQDMKILNLLMEKGDFADIESEAINMELKPDSRISPGGVVVESDKGMVDAQIETRISSIEEALEHELAGE